MKCTNCGNNNACYHYKYNINGNITEAHLCPDCAAKMEGNGEFKELNDMFGQFDSMFSGFDRMFNNVFSDPFFGRTFSPFRSFGMPTLVMPRIAFAVPANATQTEEKTETGNKADPRVDPELSKKREINALREEMKAAAEAENYEKAAEIRDKLRKMENTD